MNKDIKKAMSFLERERVIVSSFDRGLGLEIVLGIVRESGGGQNLLCWPGIRFFISLNDHYLRPPPYPQNTKQICLAFKSKDIESRLPLEYSYSVWKWW